MIVCYTTSTTNNEETAEGNIDEAEENDNTEQDEQRVDIVECKKRLREVYETILMYEVPLDDFDRKLHRQIRMRLADSCAILFYKNKRITKKKAWESILNSTSVPANIIDEVRSSSGADSASKISSSSNRSSTSSLSYQIKLSVEDRLVLEANHSKINKKWLLKSGACVEDAIYKKAIDFSYEHPMHSYILNTNDAAWKIASEPDEVEEIMEASSENGFNNPLPNEMLDTLSKLNKKKTFDEMYQAFKNVEADRYDQRALYWLKETVLNYIDLFHDENKITMNTEQDLLEEVYGFIRRSRTLCSTRTETASGSMASSEAKNGSRTLGTNQALTRQAAGDHADLV
ncbi:hypothetical protein G6F46_006772 [Rhizopus delemar]|nr:hypothetical protein G6F55_007986 [Rhizopus delemar]KAG1539290.1 hypothetical protein G6F51_009228 [Rhizopus arrhizus]KAG1522211.1 hypothetical protein G6F52_006056 [Rhizopus delemar]KAG1548205.1 hypothetical protein G6F49_009971 [Rhizopus delemar]KAG1566683.1 hypothetical protein G6F50_008914 [Rhizopus delemar]